MSARASSLRIVVAGLVGAYPVGGVAWDYLQYPIGLARLGHDVIYHEDTWIWPFDPLQNARVETASYSADFLAGFFKRYAPDVGAAMRLIELHDQCLIEKLAKQHTLLCGTFSDAKASWLVHSALSQERMYQSVRPLYIQVRE
jgi:hypothetical protein